MGIMIAVERYAHPRNKALLKGLEKQGVKGRGDAFDLDGYQLHTHPDLCDLLRSLNPHCFGGAYGIPVLANDPGIVFALARGTSYVAFRLPDSDWEAAREAGGFDSPDLGEGWFGFEAWRTEKDLLTAWCRAAHADANKIGKKGKPS
jgi:hypothetical protein